MNDTRLSRILESRVRKIKGCTVGTRLFRTEDVGFRVETDTGAIFEVRVSVYKDAIQ